MGLPGTIAAPISDGLGEMAIPPGVTKEMEGVLNCKNYSLKQHFSTTGTGPVDGQKLFLSGTRKIYKNKD
jgi:hypothetical protein